MSGIVYRNLLLAHLGEEDRRLLEPFEPMDVDLRFSIEKAGKPITHVHFPESAVASVVLQSGSFNLAVEMGVTGLEGMTGLPLLYGDDRSAMETFIQIPGRMSRITAKRFVAAIESSSTLKAFFPRYARTVHDQVASTATANAAGAIELRLARWLLMCQDRVGKEHIHLSHNFLAIMLGIRRASVTDAISRLEGRHLIRLLRMDFEILDRARLQSLFRGRYGNTERGYERIMGFSLSTSQPQLSKPWPG
ncbi:helix-turn-helix domain-containing protein [Rhizobium sp. XQZ8]|uniref:Crp/Fnr family transcriptional regulator n=1 Tax=Rhizobium populisoli TaxID=2859785 RepID=UPI001CA47542|nr:helix-turn-helix domain-containing protein [Rhizobium populisoli]MBW6426096.1 helix-turn-helix domain-containing protein [Rhizobium populisoli]